MALSKLNRKGVTLIMVAGVLAILAALGAGFYTVSISQNKSAMRYADSVRADMMARAGISDAIARLQDQAFYKTEDPTDPWYMTDWLHAAARHVSFPSKVPGTANNLNNAQYASYSKSLSNSVGPLSDRYTLNISDASSKINVNAGDNLGVILDNLCRVIGAPLIAADLGSIQPRRWYVEGAPSGLFDNANNVDDRSGNYDLYYRVDADNRAIQGPDGNALYGDGYAIAAYRARNGRFARLDDVRYAFTTAAHPGHPELEDLERSVKFNAMRDYITIDSWVDTNTVCVGKFEWADINSDGSCVHCIDRDKSWISSVDTKFQPITDPQNTRGSLVGSYVSIVSGHGAGQLRRIAQNGIDWIEVDVPFVIAPGPTSCYMIVSKEDALLNPLDDLKGQIVMDSTGHFADDPNIDYVTNPLCIHRAPVNINTASDKVLEALFLGINCQHGTPLAVGTGADPRKIRKAWFQTDTLKLFYPPYITNTIGQKRIPQDNGELVLDRPEPWTDATNFGYINNYRTLSQPNFVDGGGLCNEAHELAYRIIVARQARINPNSGLPMLNDLDPLTQLPRGPFKSWDDFFFRVVQPWDNLRVDNSRQADGTYTKLALAPMIMANFNSNTDILKFNPNIEWIDRWGRNFTSMEPYIAFVNGQPDFAKKLTVGPIPPGAAAPAGATPPPVKGAPLQANTANGIFYFIRNMRYRFGEMIDKTDLNRSTTEFTMDAGGVYEISSVGQVVADGIPRAERKLEALVKVYDVWRESTQRQFVEGTFSNALRKNHNGGSSGFTDAGKITRDNSNINTYRALDTLPEPLVPLLYRLKPYPGGRFMECVDDGPKDAWGNLTQPNHGYKNLKTGYDVPDVIANGILPAGYDGQLVLAANTEVFDPAAGPKGHADSFLASFNGDLDTDTCVGNGREQAKTPHNPTIRVCDTISLMGLLNDSEVDFDCDSVELADNSNPIFLINLSTQSVSMKSFNVDDPSYDHNLSVRQGDLRADGVFLGILGVSCKDATLKYAYGDGASGGNNQVTLAAGKNPAGPASIIKNQNYDPGNPNGCTISMWIKTAWNASDHLEHEFFNGSANGQTWYARDNKLWKNGYVTASTDTSGNQIGEPYLDTTLAAVIEEYHNDDASSALHGGLENVSALNLPPNRSAETPSYYFQPFRWAFVGQVHQFGGKGNFHLSQSPAVAIATPTGYNAYVQSGAQWYGINYDDKFGFREASDGSGTNVDMPSADSYVKNIIRPFTSTARYPEGNAFRSDNACVVNGLRPDPLNAMDTNTTYHFIEQDAMPSTGGVGGLGTMCDLDGQPAAYTWAQNKNAARFMEGVFSINNTNQGKAPYVVPPPMPPPPPAPPKPPAPTPPPPAPAPPGPPRPPPPPTPVPVPPVRRGVDPTKAVAAQDAPIAATPVAKLDQAPAVQAVAAPEHMPEADLSGVSTLINNVIGGGEMQVETVGLSNDPYGNPFRHLRFAAPKPGGGGAAGTGLKGPFCHIYKQQPTDTTYATIDEFRISKRRWTTYEIADEMTLSRYYLPANPADSSQLPTFTSQSLVQSLQGATATSTDLVAPARVSWNVFTPRFMQEYKLPGKYTRTEIVGGQVMNSVKFRGPFDYAQYNWDLDYDAQLGWKSPVYNKPNKYLQVDRVPPVAGVQSSWSKGVEVELVTFSGTSPGAAAGAILIPGSVYLNNVFTMVGTFTDPEAGNCYVNPNKPGQHTMVSAGKLHYRVRFKYPVDRTFIDPAAAKDTVDPGEQYLLDTPVFDDISIVYVQAPKIIHFKEAVE